MNKDHLFLAGVTIACTLIIVASFIGFAGVTLEVNEANTSTAALRDLFGGMVKKNTPPLQISGPLMPPIVAKIICQRGVPCTLSVGVKDITTYYLPGGEQVSCSIDFFATKCIWTPPKTLIPGTYYVIQEMRNDTTTTQVTVAIVVQ